MTPSPAKAPANEETPPKLSMPSGAKESEIEPITAENIGVRRATKPIPLPKGVNFPTFASKNARKAAMDRYLRSLKEPTVRSARKEKVPQEIQMKMLGGFEKNFYFAMYQSQKCDWGKVKLWEEAYLLNMAINEKKHQWLTEKQLEKLYCFDTDIVADLVAAKRKNIKWWRRHPEIPTCERAIQYKCMIEDSQISSVQQILKQGVGLMFEPSGSAGDLLVEKRLSEVRDAVDAGGQQPVSLGNGGFAGHTLSADEPTAGGTIPELGGEGKDSEEKEMLRKAIAKVKEQKEKAAARKQKLDEDKIKKEKMKDTLGYKAKSMCNTILKRDVDDCKKQESLLEEANCPVPPEVASSFLKQLQSDRKIIEETRSQMGRLLPDPDSNEEEFSTLMEKARSATENFKNTLRTCKSVHKRYEMHKSDAAGAAGRSDIESVG